MDGEERGREREGGGREGGEGEVGERGEYVRTGTSNRFQTGLYEDLLRPYITVFHYPVCIQIEAVHFGEVD